MHVQLKLHAKHTNNIHQLVLLNSSSNWLDACPTVHPTIADAFDMSCIVSISCRLTSGGANVDEEGLAEPADALRSPSSSSSDDSDESVSGIAHATLL